MGGKMIEEISTNNSEVEPIKKTSKKRVWLIISIVFVCLIIFYSVFGFVTIQPIGMIPDGITLMVVRVGTKVHFFDSPDGLCLRLNGELNLICRMAMISAIGENTKIVLRLPYSKAIYLSSTGGREFEQ